MKGRSILLLATLPAALVLLPVGYAQNNPSIAQQVAYKVVDGSKVDSNTLQGWKTWRALACERCHGAQQQGMVGPSLIDAFKTPSGIIGNVFSYEHKGKQYIGVFSGIGGWAGIGMAAGLEKDTDGLGAVGGYRELNQYTELGGSLTVFALPSN